MIGKITKGIAGFYYVHSAEVGMVECKARGLFRKQNLKPLVGDWVEIELLDRTHLKGNIIKLLPRQNQLIRPLVANVDQVIIVFAVADPAPNYHLLDRFIVAIEKEGIEIVLCFNKTDVLEEASVKEVISTYEKVGYALMTTSVKEMKGLHVLREQLKNKTTVFAGPSGVGKSSLLNELQSSIEMETGAISEKIKRGKHTTRHAELIDFDENSYLVDTPGFSSIYLNELDANEIKHYFIEFSHYEPYCKFQGCAHMNEPECGVKEAVKNGEISRSRYESYQTLYEELKDQRRW